DPANVKALTDASGVTAHSGPYPVVPAILEANGRRVVVQAEGRDTAAAPVDQPKPTRGSWVRPGGVVLEAAFAEALGVGPRDQGTLTRVDVNRAGGDPTVHGRGGGRSFQVAGVAVTAAAPPYPEPACLANLCVANADTGLAWVTRSDAESLNPEQQPLIHIVNLKLADPAAAPAFAANVNPPIGNGAQGSPKSGPP